MVGSNQAVVAEYLRTELQLKKGEAKAMGIHCSPIGVIPKKNKPGKWRLIVNLSAPEGASVNDGMDKEMPYTSVDVVANKVAMLGRGSLLAKLDIMQAYRMVPVHPNYQCLLGMQWENDIFVDRALPFGLR